MLFFGIRLRHFRIDGLFIIPKMPNSSRGFCGEKRILPLSQGTTVMFCTKTRSPNALFGPLTDSRSPVASK